MSPFPPAQVVFLVTEQHFQHLLVPVQKTHIPVVIRTQSIAPQWLACGF